jgi:hypothetical protein
MPLCDEVGFKAFSMERFLNRILCMRCHRFHKRSVYIANQLHTLALKVYLISQRESSPTIIEYKRKMRLDMITLVADFVANAGQYYKVMPIPAPEVADVIMESPASLKPALKNVMQEMAGRAGTIREAKLTQANDND